MIYVIMNHVKFEITIMVDYCLTRYYRGKDLFIWCLWKLGISETIPASEQDLTQLLDQAEMLNNLM